MSEKEVADLVEPIEEPMWHYSGGRSSGKSYFEEVLNSKDKEIERLNKELIEEKEVSQALANSNVMLANIITELEKDLEEAVELYDNGTCKIFLDRLKELKGSGKE
jgi:DNA-binding ferritin-like protein